MSELFEGKFSFLSPALYLFGRLIMSFPAFSVATLRATKQPPLLNLLIPRCGLRLAGEPWFTDLRELAERGEIGERGDFFICTLFRGYKLSFFVSFSYGGSYSELESSLMFKASIA